MINKLLIIVLLTSFYSVLFAQLEVVPMNNFDNPSDNLENLIMSDLLGCSVEVSNIEYSGAFEAMGSFNYVQNQNLCNGTFGLDRGILMTTGMVEHALGPNNDGDNGVEWNIQYADDFTQQYLVDFNVISSSVDLYDASVLEFDVTSSSINSLNFEVIFGSEEYPEWVTPFYADAFCFFVSELGDDIDPNFNSTPQNIMETGSILNLSNVSNCIIENKPISVWTIRPYSQVFNLPGMNECLYVNNENGGFCDAIGYDGYTIPMLFNLTLLPEATYHVKMVILDGAGGGLDSGVFIKKADMNNFLEIDFTWSEPDYTAMGATVSFNNISAVNVNSVYFWDFNNDGNIDSTEPNPVYIFEEPGNYTVTLEVSNECTGETDIISYDIFIDANFSLSDSVGPVFNFYPNPCVTSFSISTIDLKSDFSLDLIDASGRVIKSVYCNGVVNKINVLDMMPGVYYARIRNNEHSFIHYEKVIIL